MPLLAALALLSNSATPLKPVPFTNVEIADSFWAPKQEVNRKVSIPHTFDQCEKTGRLSNFDLAAKGARTGFKGLIFDDSDVYKSLEGAAYALASKSDPKLDARVDSIIARIAAAQMPDGYLNTYYQINSPEKRFTNLRDNHELYCAGHLFEAGVAHFQATGKRTLLNVATKYADLLCRVFGTQGREGYPGHPETELALMKLWKATGEQRYFDLAEFFLNTRGSHWYAREHKTPEGQYDGTYWLDDVPIRDHKEIKGHAVRAAYLFSGAADLAMAKPDNALIEALDRVWKNTVFKRVFVTGGIGPSASNEGFTVDYDLPTESAYQETCASVAMALWNHRMGLLHGEAKYWDHVERALYNGFLSGVSIEGSHFFYVNALGSSGNHQRTEWFGCACCPPNVTRTLASLGSYLYATSDTGLHVNLLVGGSVETQVGGTAVDLRVKTRYPWDGAVTLTAGGNGPAVDLLVRRPGWAPATVEVTGGGPSRRVTAQSNGYWNLGKISTTRKTWTVSIPMSVQTVVAHPAAKDLEGRVAIQRGPMIYCFEGHENPEAMDRVYVAPETAWKPVDSKLLGGITMLQGQGRLAERAQWQRTLYQPTAQTMPVFLKGIPYFAWANRGASPMTVWLRNAPPHEMPGGLEQSAELKVSFANSNSTPSAVRDGRPIESSSKHPGALCHFWPHKGTQEYVQYTWANPVSATAVEVYWFDDTGVGEIRPPAEWWIEVSSNGSDWKRVQTSYGVELNQWNRVPLDGQAIKGLRVVTKGQPNWSVGLHEVRISEE